MTLGRGGIHRKPELLTKTHLVGILSEAISRLKKEPRADLATRAPAGRIQEGGTAAAYLLRARRTRRRAGFPGQNRRGTRSWS